MNENYTISEIFTLPSLGKLYTPEIDPVIELRSMTTNEEQRRLSSSDHPYKVLCDIIDSCIVNDCGVSSYDMCIGDYLYLLHKLRVVTYGSEYAMDSMCPVCGCIGHETIDLDELPVLKYSEDILKYFEFDLPKSKKHIKLRILTPRMLDILQLKTNEFKKKVKDTNIPAPTLVYLVSDLIDTIDGQSPDRFKLEEWVKNLPLADTNTIVTYAEKCNGLIGIDTNLNITCDICGVSHSGMLKMDKEFFRPALNI